MIEGISVIHVLWWRYSDGSGQGILRAYFDKRRADEDMDLLSGCTDREYKLEPVAVYHDGKPKA